MANDIGNLLIGLAVIITTITTIICKIKCIRSRCASCLALEKSFDRDLEEAAKVANNTPIPRVIWPVISSTLKRTLSPKEIKVAETVLETIEAIGEESTKK